MRFICLIIVMKMIRHWYKWINYCTNKLITNLNSCVAKYWSFIEAAVSLYSILRMKHLQLRWNCVTTNANTHAKLVHKILDTKKQPLQSRTSDFVPFCSFRVNAGLTSFGFFRGLWLAKHLSLYIPVPYSLIFIRPLDLTPSTNFRSIE